MSFPPFSDKQKPQVLFSELQSQYQPLNDLTEGTELIPRSRVFELHTCGKTTSVGNKATSNTVDGRNPFRTTFETMGNHCLLVLTEESAFRGFLGGAGFRPSTVVTP